MGGTALGHISEHLDSTLGDAAYASVAAVPTEFDSRTKWPGLVHPIRDQQHCGSCWAFSASEVLSDRVAIATGKASPVLSVEDMVSCDSGDNGCGGGRLPSAWQYLQNTGIVTDSCFPYGAGGSGSCLRNEVRRLRNVCEDKGAELVCNQHCAKHDEGDFDTWPNPSRFHGVQELHELP